MRVFTLGLAGRGDGYQCGLDWGRSSILFKLNRKSGTASSCIFLFPVSAYELVHNKHKTNTRNTYTQK